MPQPIQSSATTYVKPPAEVADSAPPQRTDGPEVQAAVQQITGDMVARDAAPAAAPSGDIDLDSAMNALVTQMMVSQVSAQAAPPTTNIDMNSSNPFGGAFADPFGAGNDEEEEEEAAAEEAKRG
jgi:hypothetical protein